MSFINVLGSVIAGAFLILVVLLIGYGFYLLLRRMKVVEYFKFLFVKIPDEIFEEVAPFIINKPPFNEFAEYISKFPLKTQNKYIKAYLKLSKLNTEQEVKNGK